MTALEPLEEGDKIAKLLKRMRKNAFKQKEGGRKEAKKVSSTHYISLTYEPITVKKKKKWNKYDVAI